MDIFKYYSNYNYFNKVKNTLIDPLAADISNEIKWIKLDPEWGEEKFPVVICGKGKPILFLHGFDSSFLEFRRIFPYFKDNYKVIIPDLLGFGFSPRLSIFKYNSENIVLNLINIISKLNIHEKINIVGASMGGSVALSLSKKIENAIDKNILLSPAGLLNKPQKIPKPFNQIGAAFLGLPTVRKNLCKQAFAFPDISVGLMEEQIASIHLGCSGWRNSLASFAKNGGFGNTYQYFKKIPIKTICGENDRILGNNELNKLKNIKDLNFLSLKNCGHLPHLDLPELTGKIILDFFNNS